MADCPRAIHAQAAAWTREFVDDWKADMGQQTTAPKPSRPAPEATAEVAHDSPIALPLTDAEWDGAFRAGELTGYWSGFFEGAVVGLAAGTALVVLAICAGFHLG
jgi:hypothetical protein